MGKAVGFIVVIIVTILFLVTFINIANSSYKYHLNLPEASNIKSIVIEKNNGKVDDGKKEIKDAEEIQKILNTLIGKGRKTKEESIQDTPVNAKDIIKVDFNHVEGGTSTIFLYRKMPQLYLEQPYNGIYQITSDDYYAISDYVK